jgi:hypothetical protein
VSRLLNGALEEEVVGDVRLGLDELQERLADLQVRAQLQQVLRPFNEHSAHCASVKLRHTILEDLIHLGAGKCIVAQYLLHVLFEDVLQLNCLLEEQTDVLVDGLEVDVGRVDIGLGREVLQQVEVSFCTRDIGEFYFLGLPGLRVTVLELLENVK